MALDAFRTGLVSAGERISGSDGASPWGDERLALTSRSLPSEYYGFCCARAIRPLSYTPDWSLGMDATLSDSQASTDPQTREFKSRPGVAWSFRKSRDRWKAKCKQLKADIKRHTNRVADVIKSREHWRTEAEAARSNSVSVRPNSPHCACGSPGSRLKKSRHQQPVLDPRSGHAAKSLAASSFPSPWWRPSSLWCCAVPPRCAVLRGSSMSSVPWQAAKLRRIGRPADCGCSASVWRPCGSPK